MTRYASNIIHFNYDHEYSTIVYLYHTSNIGKYWYISQQLCSAKFVLCPSCYRQHFLLTLQGATLLWVAWLHQNLKLILLQLIMKATVHRAVINILVFVYQWVVSINTVSRMSIAFSCRNKLYFWQTFQRLPAFQPTLQLILFYVLTMYQQSWLCKVI